MDGLRWAKMIKRTGMVRAKLEGGEEKGKEKKRERVCPASGHSCMTMSHFLAIYAYGRVYVCGWIDVAVCISCSSPARRSNIAVTEDGNEE